MSESMYMETKWNMVTFQVMLAEFKSWSSLISLVYVFAFVSNDNYSFFKKYILYQINYTFRTF